jgi:sulfur-carrier protein
MTITVRFFAHLREQIGHSEVQLPATDVASVRDAWQQAAQRALPANTLASVNLEYAGLDAPVRDGDEVAFFPPVTGG